MEKSVSGRVSKFYIDSNRGMVNVYYALELRFFVYRLLFSNQKMRRSGKA